MSSEHRILVSLSLTACVLGWGDLAEAQSPKQLQDDIKALSQQLKDTKTQMDATVNQLKAQLAQNQAQVNDVKAQNQAQVNELKAQLTALTAEINQLKAANQTNQQTVQGVTNLGNQIQAANTRIDALGGRVDQVRAETNARIDQSTQTLQGQATTLQTQITALQQKFFVSDVIVSLASEPAAKRLLLRSETTRTSLGGARETSVNMHRIDLGPLLAPYELKK